MTQEAEQPLEVPAESADFNVFVGASTGLLKGVSLNPNSNLCKNFTNNLHALDRAQHEITCMSWANAKSTTVDQNDIFVGLRNGIVRRFNCVDKKFERCNVRARCEDPANVDPLVGMACYDDAIITAAQSGNTMYV